MAAQLEHFLLNEGQIDRRAVMYMLTELLLESLSDFASFWTSEDYENGVRDDVISNVVPFNSDLSLPEAKLQVARLRAAWRKAQGVPSAAVPLQSAKPHTSGGKAYETGFHYLLEAHELGGKNADGGFGGPLCADPFSPEIEQLCQALVREAQDDKTLCYEHFTKPCPQLTKKQVELCKGFDYGDKTLKLPCGPLPWPAGLPEPGYVPKTNLLHGRWITVSGGQAAFIKEAIKAGMLGSAEAHKITADTYRRQTGGMYMRINQNGDVCTIDASVATFARAKRTFKSGHYFYEPLVSGGNLLGVWVLPDEHRKIGFFWDMDSGRCFRIERRAFERNGLMIMRQATEVAGKISFVFYVKVSNDPESTPIPLQSRDYTALAGLDNVPDNLGNPYPCEAKDLDYPIKRDTWLDKNQEEMLKQRSIVGTAFAKCSDRSSEVHDTAMGG